MIKKFFCIIILCSLFNSCKEYKFVITDKNKNQYTFYPVNKNSIQWLNADTNNKLIYSFEADSNRYQLNSVISIRGKNKMIHKLIFDK